MKRLHVVAAALMLGIAACASTPGGGVSTPSGPAAIPSSPLDLGDWRRASAEATLQGFQRTINQRYGAGLEISAVAADLRRNDFSCSAPGAGQRGDPPSQVCRKTETVNGCTHTWQAHLYDSGGDNRLARSRGLYDRRCGGDGLLGGPGR
ncbi:MAG TPA: hypothetical protein PLS69_00720 [Terricaulis sp.]|nr:hypothetical protein [Terricaulis sp.]HRP11201.1 hypothetical protein [Terricaulis sp.]